MRCDRLISCAVLFAGISCSTEAAWRFDFGPGDEALGYTKMASATAYSAGAGYGFSAESGYATRDRITDSRCPSQSQLVTDLVYNENPYEFKLDVPNGVYRVRVLTGEPISTQVAYDLVVEGETNLVPARAKYDVLWFETDATVSDGQLNLYFDAPVGTSRVNLNALTVEPIAEAGALSLETLPNNDLLIHAQPNLVVLFNGADKGGNQYLGYPGQMEFNGTRLLHTEGVKIPFYVTFNDAVFPASMTVERSSDDLIEIVSNFPVTYSDYVMQTHYIFRRGVPGMYSHHVVSNTLPTTNIPFIGNFRPTVRPIGGLFHTGYSGDKWLMPMYSESDFVEEVADATYRLAPSITNDDFYTKYEQVAYAKNDDVHGFLNDSLGLWVVHPSKEAITGGPMKQYNSVHQTIEYPVLLAYYHGGHFITDPEATPIPAGWSKTYGPWLLYMNEGDSLEAMVADAEARAAAEQAAWPYDWTNDEVNLPTRRFSVSGNISLPVRDGVQTTVLLARPGDDWLHQYHEYIFWDETDASGAFSVDKVRPGSYTVYVYGGGVSSHSNLGSITVSDSDVDLGALRREPPRGGFLQWQIGKADRTTSGFLEADTQRDFEKWYDYPDLFPDDVAFTIGSSDEANDWYYCQPIWQDEAGLFHLPTWDVNFDLPVAPDPSVTAQITIGIAGSNGDPTLIVRVNGTEVGREKYSHNSMVSRAASLSAEYMESVYRFDADLLQAGSNTIELEMGKGIPSSTDRFYYPVASIAYDTVYLEIDDVLTDSDADTLPDFWELEQAGNLVDLGVPSDGIVQLSADADAYVMGENPTVNCNDSSNRLMVRSLGDPTCAKYAYVRFDLSDYIGLDGGTVFSLTSQEDSATFNGTQMHVWGLTDAAGVTPQNWKEDSLTYNTTGTEFVKPVVADIDPLEPGNLVYLGTLTEHLVPDRIETVTLSGTAFDEFLDTRVGRTVTLIVANVFDANSNSIFFSSEESVSGNGSYAPTLQIAPLKGKDSDGDGVDDAFEYALMTDPTDSQDFMEILSHKSVTNGYAVEWNSRVFVNYQVQWTTNLVERSWNTLPTVYQGTGGTLDCVIDSQELDNTGSLFLRVIRAVEN